MEKTTPTASVVQNEPNNPSLTVAKAAFAFRDALDASRSKEKSVPVSNVKEMVATPQAAEVVDPVLESERAHMRRHQRNVRVARTIQHLMTSLLSLAIIGLQAKVTDGHFLKDVELELKENKVKQMIPALMLLVTAILAIIFDISAITAYMWPETTLGIKAFTFASRVHYIVSTFKSVAYAYSAIACTSMIGGGTPMMVSQCLSAVNIAIEVFGLLIDQYTKRDAERFKSLQDAGTASPEAPAPAPAPATGDSSDKQSPLPTYSYPQRRTEKLGDAEFGQLDTFGNSFNSDLESAKPKISSS